VLYRLTSETSVFAQYARGFLAPTPSQVNNGFTNGLSFYQTIANPDLRPESSNTVELGVRGKSQSLSYDLTFFNSRYEDFIFFEQIRGNFTPASPAIFQSINVGKVTIRGAEAKFKAAINKNVSITGSYAYARGDDRSSGQPLNTVDPQKLVLAAQYQATQWGAQAVATRVEQKRRLPASTTPGVPLFASPAYQTFDAYLWWRPLPQLTLNAALLNLGDKKYWVWQDVRGVLSNSASLDAFTQPGRTASIAAKWTF
jgi:hemoglobin/transferrin/lactoferrin receptor protein